MQINTLKLSTPRKAKKVIGRGGKKGTYSGKGNKGQKARSGAKINPLYEGGRSSLIDHMKKKRGFKSIKPKSAIVQLASLEKKFKDGSKIDMESLVNAGLLDKSRANGKVKILGQGKSPSKLTIDKKILLSAGSKKAIEEAGGKVE